MPGTGHCRCHITTGAVNNLDRNFSPLVLDGVKRLFVAAAMLAVFSRWHFRAAAHAGPPMLSPLLRLIRRTGAFLMVDNAAGKSGGHSR